MRRNRSVRRLIYLFIGLFGAYIYLCYLLAGTYLSPLRVTPVRPAELSEVEVPSRFGPTPSWCTPALTAGKASPVIFLLAHGYGGSRGSWAEPMLQLKRRGYDSLALSMPGQDASPVRRVGFGVTEAQVIADAVKWLREVQPHHKVVVLGVSMGGAAAWLASRENPQIDGIVTDAAFARFDEPMNAFFDRKLWHGSFFFAPVVWLARRMSGVDPNAINPVEAAALWKGKPALVIQGDADTLVVPSHAVRLSGAAACEIWSVHGARHAECYEADSAGYLNHLIKFAERLEQVPAGAHSAMPHNQSLKLSRQQSPPP